MKASLTLDFEDGSQTVLTLSKAIEINTLPQTKQSLCFNQTSKGDWVMSFTKAMFEGKKINTISMKKTREV